jgi:hypothetical protein
MQIENVTIKSIKLDGNEKTEDNYPISISTLNLDDKSPYDNNVITLTLTDDITKLPIAEHVITIDLNIVINGLNYVETQTILIQKSGGENACHLEVTEDLINVTALEIQEKNGELNLTTDAILFDGTKNAVGVEYSAEFIDCEGTYDSESGKITINKMNKLCSDALVKVTARYKGQDYTKNVLIR